MATETFILKFLSPETNCSCHELRFEAERKAIAGILNVDPEDLRDQLHSLDADELAGFAVLLRHPLPHWEGDIMLARPQSLDDVPYLVHTNFELPLMLDGRKPFAVLSGERDFEWLEIMRACFRPHVERRAIVERITEHQVHPVTIVIACYALPGEEWRFDSYDTLKNEPGPWTDDMERRLGMLLGYSKEQCDWWIANRTLSQSAIATTA